MMKIQNRQFDKNRGSALILVVVVTILLAVIGVMFLMVSRLSEMETVTIADSRDLDGAVETVVTRIHEVLATDYEDPTDYTLPWLASLEPDASSGYQWGHITDLYNNIGPTTAPSMVISAGAQAVVGAPADADGDGVADSLWVKVPGLTTSRGKDIFAAIRIIDNCAMLNLNTAHCFYQEPYNPADPISPFAKPWFRSSTATTPYHDNQSSGSGRYVTEFNYLPFLRGRDLNGTFWGADAGDGWYNLMSAKGFSDTTGTVLLSPLETHNILMNLEYFGVNYHLFDIGDELEIRNRYLVTSPVEARFEQKAIANFSLDSGSTDYAALQVPRDNADNTIDIWYERLDPANFDAWTGGPNPYKYDRRHVCTFYSFDRSLRRGEYPFLRDNFAALGWTQEQIGQAEPVFMPGGAVTTNIENPNATQPYNNLETRKRILHLLFAFREYFYSRNGNDLTAAAKSAAQVVANMIDYTDDDAINPTSVNRQGPFYDALYGTQANVDCTFITEDIIQDMIDEVSEGLIPAGTMDFGLPAGEVIFGYERQPFFSEIYANWDEGPRSDIETDDQLLGFGIELVNPYSGPDSIDMEGWKLVIGKGASAREFVFSSAPAWDIPAYDNQFNRLGRAVYHGTGAVPINTFAGVLLTDPIAQIDDIRQLYYEGGGSVEIQLMRPAPTNSGISYICVDSIDDTTVRSILNRTPDGGWVCQRDDNNWKFVFNEYSLPHQASPVYQMGLNNQDTTARTAFLQVGVADDGRPANRWQDLEVLSQFGNSADPNDSSMTVTAQLVDAASSGKMLHFDFTSAVDSPSAYIAPVARPDYGSVPGRININTAPAVVMAAAIPPTLADPNAATTDPVGFSALDAAQAIVANRPYQNLGDLMNVGWVRQYYSGGSRANENVGCQSIRGDIEEEHWVLSNLANKFTVRSDVFTAYILVRLGTDGPQRRMLAIFDRSNVWDENDRPELVALHPVPNPR